jgi:hypothetical protein
MQTENNCELKVPSDKEIIDTPIAHFWFDDCGILYSVAKSKPRTIRLICESEKILKSKIGDDKVCLISETSNTTYYTIEMRDELARVLSSLIQAIALVPCTPTGKMTASILFMRNTGFPAKIFDNLEDARHWIRKYSAQIKNPTV